MTPELRDSWSTWETDLTLDNRSDESRSKPSITLGRFEGFKTHIGVTETVSPDGTEHRSSAARITFFNPEGTVINKIP